MSTEQKTVNQKMDELLNLASTPVEEEIVPTKSLEVVSHPDNPDLDMMDDYAFVRNGLRTEIEKTNELVDTANFFAKEKQDARSTEAAAMAHKEHRENLMALLNMHKIRKDIERVSTTSPGGDVTVTQNNAFVGTTGELLKFMKDLNSGSAVTDALKIIDVQPEQKALNIGAVEEDDA